MERHPMSRKDWPSAFPQGRGADPEEQPSSASAGIGREKPFSLFPRGFGGPLSEEGLFHILCLGHVYRVWPHSVVGLE